MLKGMKKDGLWYKIEDISKIKKSEYIKFEFKTEDFDKVMKKLLPQKTTRETKTKKVSNT